MQVTNACLTTLFAVKLMLCLLENMKDMSPYWQKHNLEAVLTRMMQLEPDLNILFSKVTAQSVT